MKYVLIWIMIHNGYPYTGTAEFDSAETCKAAAQQVRDHLIIGYLSPREMIVCVRK